MATADGHVELQNQNNVGDIGCVDDQRCQLHAQCSTRIAGSGNCLEIDIGRNQEQIGGAHHPKRMHGSVLQVGYVGINSQNQLGEHREKQCQRKYEEGPAPMRLLTSDPQVEANAMSTMNSMPDTLRTMLVTASERSPKCST